jgi:hypothetical protein
VAGAAGTLPALPSRFAEGAGGSAGPGRDHHRCVAVRRHGQLADRLRRLFVDAFGRQDAFRLIGRLGPRQIIDKDRRPRWQPATLADVPDGLVDAGLAGDTSG